MAYNLLISDNANVELEKILLYISENLANPGAAKNFIQQVELCYEHLIDNPFIYSSCHNKELKDKGYRKAIIKNYVMIYRVNKESNKVYILHFFFGRQDYMNLI